MSDLEPMRCASCSEELRPRRTEHGIVWLCGSCVAGATTLGVLRKVAPRPFINHLWQASQLHGRASAKRCPSCTQPLLDLDGTGVALSPSLLVCCRCLLVWLEKPSLEAFRLEKQRVRSAVREAEAHARVVAASEPERIAREARDSVLFALAAGQQLAAVIDEALGEQEEPGTPP
jgi:hypothetical protein